MGSTREKAAKLRAARHKARRKDAGRRYGAKVREVRDQSFSSLSGLRKLISDMVTQNPDMVDAAMQEAAKEGTEG